MLKVDRNSKEAGDGQNEGSERKDQKERSMLACSKGEESMTPVKAYATTTLQCEHTATEKGSTSIFILGTVGLPADCSSNSPLQPETKLVENNRTITCG